MSAESSIEWTDATWNPVRGCVKVSAGCKHCYAETFAERFRGVEAHPYEQGFDLRLVPEKLDWPLAWRGSKQARAEGRASRIFVNSMSDLFQDGVPFEFIAAVYGVMAVSPYTFQVLTKRPERRLAFHRWLAEGATPQLANMPPDLVVQRHARVMIGERFPLHPIKGTLRAYPWPLRNVWEGVSCENQDAADDRVPKLLQTPAVVRFVSAEPLLGPIDFGKCRGLPIFREAERVTERGMPLGNVLRVRDGRGWVRHDGNMQPWLDWIIVGGESGPGARPCDVAWIASIIEQCRAASVPCFVKQLGAYAVLDRRYDRSIPGATRRLRDRKGADPEEWPALLRVQESPVQRGDAAGR